MSAPPASRVAAPGERPVGTSEGPPASHLTRLELVVRFCETDMMGIVHHANYLQYFEAGRVAWLKARGVAYEAWVARGLHLPVVEANVRYRRAARFDDALAVDTWVGRLGRASVRFDYRIACTSAPGEALCEGSTLLACVDGGLHTRRLPPELDALFRAALAPGPAARDLRRDPAAGDLGEQPDARVVHEAVAGEHVRAARREGPRVVGAHPAARLGHDEGAGGGVPGL